MWINQRNSLQKTSMIVSLRANCEGTAACRRTASPLILYKLLNKMGIFNEQSFDHPFAKGIQGAPGVGFNLTADGNYDMVSKKTNKSW